MEFEGFTMSFIRQVFPGRGKHKESFSLEAVSTVNDTADMHSDPTRDTQGLDKLSGGKQSAVDTLLQRISELEATQKQQVAMLHGHTEYIQALERRIQDLESVLTHTTTENYVVVKHRQSEWFGYTQIEDRRPTAPLPLLTRLPPGAPTMPVPVAPRLSPETPTMPLPLLEPEQDEPDQPDNKWYGKKWYDKV
jgi:hypothetical protein